MASITHHKHFGEVKKAVDAALSSREPLLQSQLQQALTNLRSKYEEVLAKHYP